MSLLLLIIGVILGYILPTRILKWLGFTGAGIAASSYAASTQAAVGNVAAGSWFACFQSGKFSLVNRSNFNMFTKPACWAYPLYGMLSLDL